jgi:iron only hydrogenase large subunit-like protein
MSRSQIIDVAKHLKNGDKMIALVAPSIVGQFPGSVSQIVSSIKKLGFSKVYEVAYGADMTAKNEAKELIEKVKSGKQSFLGTSCCPAYVEAVKKHAPEFSEFVSDTPTPMSFTGRLAKNEDSDAITVFIGPCIAKKYEGINDDSIDYVLTFEELGSFFIAKDIEVAEQEEEHFDSPKSSKAGRTFPVSGGVAEAVKFYLTQIDEKFELKYEKIDGLNKKNIRTLKNIAKGKTNANLVEVMSCEGGCIYGPGVISNPKIASRKISSYAEEK